MATPHDSQPDEDQSLRDQVESALAQAKTYLTIAESPDGRTLAYKEAATLLRHAKDVSGHSNAKLAQKVGVSESKVRKLLAWQEAGFKGDSPFTMDETASARSTISHARKALHDNPQEIANDIAAAMKDPKVAETVIRAMPVKTATQVGAIEARVATERQARQSSGKPNLRLVTEDDKPVPAPPRVEDSLERLILNARRANTALASRIEHQGIVLDTMSAKDALDLVNAMRKDLDAVAASLREHKRASA